MVRHVTGLCPQQDNIEASINQLLASAPSQEDFVLRLHRYDAIVTDISSLMATSQLGWMLLDPSALCRSLLAEANKWKHAIGVAFVDWMKQQIAALKEFLDATDAQLCKPVDSLKNLGGMPAASALMVGCIL